MPNPSCVRDVLESRVKGASGQVEENAVAGCHVEYLGKIREDPVPTLSNLKREKSMISEIRQEFCEQTPIHSKNTY